MIQKHPENVIVGFDTVVTSNSIPSEDPENLHGVVFQQPPHNTLHTHRDGPRNNRNAIH